MNPVALITGGSRGIGRGIALELAKLGWDLALNFKSNSAAAERTAAEVRALGQPDGPGLRACLCQADISLASGREKLISAVRRDFGRLDLLVNNAGIAPAVRTDLLEGTEESFDQVLNTNVKGPFFLTQMAARWMVEQAERAEEPARPPGRIVFVTSISAYAASINRGEYCVAKAALAMLTPLYAARLARHGINVYEVRPGIIRTDMTEPVHEKYDRLIQEGLTPIRRWGSPDDVGKAVAAIAQGLLPFSTGEVINVDGGFHIRQL